jgi:glycosyltransferase involved in cell wall biosynthesis
MNTLFKPCYVWPNSEFPFRIYYADEKCRIFIIENLQHNYLWLKKYRNKIKKNDHFLVLVGCHYHEWLVDEAVKMFASLSLSKEYFHILFNDEREKKIFSSFGFSGELVNQNAFLDENLVMRIIDIPKKYDAIYVARLIELKRHNLCSELGNLALVSGKLHGAIHADYIPKHVYLNERQLSPDEVCIKINEAYCGLILSAFEGASFSSSEYLLCGIPVVSTTSEGGRDVWYNDYNSRIIEPDPEQVKQAVNYFANNPKDPEVIRQQHIEKAKIFRQKFICLIEEILRRCSIDYVDCDKYFNMNFKHKMVQYYAPPLDVIFD